MGARRRAVKRKMTLWEALKLCPYQTVFGRNVVAGATVRETVESVQHRLAVALVILGGDVSDPLDDAMLASMVTAIAADGVVLLASDRADLRDHAKRRIEAVTGPVAGFA